MHATKPMNPKPIPRLFLRLLPGLIYITIVFLVKLRIFSKYMFIWPLMLDI